MKTGIKRHLERRETLGYLPVQRADDGEQLGLATNLHEEGIQIQGKQAFKKGQILDIKIAVDPKLCGTDRISLTIQNVWCRAGEGTGLYLAGFQIMNLSAGARCGLRRLLDAFSYPSPGR